MPGSASNAINNKRRQGLLNSILSSDWALMKVSSVGPPLSHLPPITQPSAICVFPTSVETSLTVTSSLIRWPVFIIIYCTVVIDTLIDLISLYPPPETLRGLFSTSLGVFSLSFLLKYFLLLILTPFTCMHIPEILILLHLSFNKSLSLGVRLLPWL